MPLLTRVLRGLRCTGRAARRLAAWLALAAAWAGRQCRTEPLGTALMPGQTLLWAGLELSSTDEMNNTEAIQQLLFERYYQPTSADSEWDALESHLRELARVAVNTFPAAAFGVANGLYHFFFFAKKVPDIQSGDYSSYIAVEDMSLAAILFEVSIRFSRCFDAGLEVRDFLMGMCQQKVGMLLLLLVEIGAAASADLDLFTAAQALTTATATFAALKKVPYHNELSDLGWRGPSDLALNDELYPRTFGPVWPREALPFAGFLEEHFEVFKADLESILSQDGLFEHLRQLERNAEGLAVWPPDSRGHVELVDSREDPPFKAACGFARASCDLLASRTEIAGCPRAAAFFARLEPGAWLKPHLGNARRLAAHLGLVVPEGAVELNVGPTRGLRWRAGEALVWDDTHVHDARHRGAPGTRYILQTFFCHPCEQPELYRGASSAEARALAAPAACTHEDPVRAEVSRVMRMELDARERSARGAPQMVVPSGAPVSV